MLMKLVASARRMGASDLHVEAGMPAGFRVRGKLRMAGDPIPAARIGEAVREIVPSDRKALLIERRSLDLTRTIAGIACRINILHTSRGLGLAVRLLAGVAPTLEQLNLHPDVASLIDGANGLVLICGATGSGKSSTLAALIELINRREAAHIITLEQPIEYRFQPRRSLIRQREVGQDTPSFAQGLYDSLREDPDVIVVGEMRRPETMQLTLDAAETGHLVLATVHAGTVGEALQRIVGAFPADAERGVRAQLANAFLGGLAQSLDYLPDHGIRVPICEIARSNHAIRNHIREGAFHKVDQAVSIGAREGMWSRERYQAWVNERLVFNEPTPVTEPTVALEPDATSDMQVARPRARDTKPIRASSRVDLPLAEVQPRSASPSRPSASPVATTIEINEDDIAPIDDLIAQLEDRR